MISLLFEKTKELMIYVRGTWINAIDDLREDN